MSGGHYERGRQLYVLGRYDEARQSLERELEIAPEHVYARGLHALCVARKDKARGLELARALVGDSPTNAYAHYALGLVYDQRGEHSESVRAIRQALEIAPLNAEYLRLLAYELTRLDRWSDALPYAERAVERAPNGDDGLVLLGAIHSHFGDLERAKAAWEAALRANPEHELAHANLGWLRMRKQDPNGALPHYYDALRLDPNSEFARRGLRDALVKRKWIGRWIQFFEPIGRRFAPGVAIFIAFLGFSFALSWNSAPVTIGATVILIAVLPALAPNLVRRVLLDPALLIDRRVRAAAPDEHRVRLRRVILTVVGVLTGVAIAMSPNERLRAPIIGALATWILTYLSAGSSATNVAKWIRRLARIGGSIAAVLAVWAEFRDDLDAANWAFLGGVAAVCVTFVAVRVMKR